MTDTYKVHYYIPTARLMADVVTLELESPIQALLHVPDGATHFDIYGREGQVAGNHFLGGVIHTAEYVNDVLFANEPERYRVMMRNLRFQNRDEEKVGVIQTSTGGWQFYNYGRDVLIPWPLPGYVSVDGIGDSV